MPGIQQRSQRLIPLLFCILALGLLHGRPGYAAPGLSMNSAEGRYSLSEQVEYVQDIQGSWSLDDVVQRDARSGFKANDKATLAFGYVDTVYWLRIPVTSEEIVPTSWVLEISGLGRAIDSIDAYMPDSTGAIQHQRSGDALPFSERTIKNHAVLFSATLSPRQTTTFYLRVKTNGTLQIPLTLWSMPRYLENEHHDSILEGLFYGILLIMIFYNGFIYFSIRDNSYIIYVCYLVCVLMFAVSLKGVGLEYLWSEYPWWNNKSNLVFAELGVLFVLLFARSFLKTPKTTNYINYVIGFLILSSIACFPVVVLASHRVAAAILSVQYLFTVVFVVLAASLCLKRGFTAARYYLLAWLGVLASILVWVLNSFNLVHSYWVGAYIFQFGTAIQVLLFSFALADRINLLRAERESALKLQLAHSRRLVSMAQMFERFVPKQFLRRIAREGIENIQLGKAEADEITVLFADIRGFTALSETLTPQEILNFLNACFTRLDKVIHQHDGFIDKFMGDGVMALFEHEQQVSSARNALIAAIQMQDEIRLYNQHRANSGYEPIAIGIGINTGSVIIGTVGSSERMDSTVLGDNVNIAARLQEQTKVFGARIIISEHTEHAIGQQELFSLRELGAVTVRGRKSLVRLFEVLDADEPDVRMLKQKTLELHQRALELYRNECWEPAALLWQECLQICSDDNASRYLLGECQRRLLTDQALGSAARGAGS